MVYNFGRVCMYVCPSDLNFRNYEVHICTYVGLVCLHGTRVKFVYEGHRVRIKVTGAKMSKIPIPTCSNFGSTEHTAMKFTCIWFFGGYGGWKWNGVTAIFVT